MTRAFAVVIGFFGRARSTGIAHLSAICQHNRFFGKRPWFGLRTLVAAGWQRGGIDDPLTVGSRLQPSVPLNRPEGEPWLTVCRVKPRCVVKSQRCNSLAVMPCLVQQARRAFSGEIPSDSNSLMALVDAQTARWSTIPNMLAH
jgi:hypothetical protein